MAISDSNLVSDTFWLNMGAEIVFKSLDNRKEAVDRLQRTIAWIFSVYSLIGMGSVVFATKESWSGYTLLWFGLAFLFLIIAYWVSTAAAFPRVQDFYGNVPASIRDAYLAAVRRSSTAFTWAVVLCSIGVLIYSGALFMQFGSIVFKGCPDKPAVMVKESDSLKVNIKTISADGFAMQVESRRNSWFNWTVLSDTTVLQQTKTDTVAFIAQSVKQKLVWLYTDTSGKANISLSVNIRPNRKYYVVISRTDTLNNGATWYTVRKKINFAP